MAAKEASSIRLVATLALTGLLSGLILVAIFLVTQPVILRNQAEAMRKAVFKVLPGTASINTYVLSGDSLEPFESADGSMPSGQSSRRRSSPSTSSRCWSRSSV